MLKLSAATLAAILIFAAVLQPFNPAHAVEQAGGWRAGVAAVDITPEGPIWLAGYAARNRPSESVARRIYAKALALQPAGEDPLLLITTDLLTMPRAIAERVAADLGARHHLSRERILLAASHSHSAPVILDGLIGMYRLDAANLEKVTAYARELEEKMAGAAAQALKDLAPARLFHGSGRAGFAANRRRVNPDDPVDHDVPILVAEIDSPDPARPSRRAVVFAYACHNTTLQGYALCGDYAGFAQGSLEEGRPGLTALFLAGCGGDANPDPRGTLELAQAHGRELAGAVRSALEKPLAPIPAGARAALGWADLELPPAPGREALQSQLGDQNVFVQIRARQLLARLGSGEGIASTYPYAVQAWRLGAAASARESGFTVIALAGEVVVDYALRLKRELGSARLMVAAYANDAPGYIPSERVLREGGYEGGGAMLYYGFHGPWAAGLEERIFNKIHQLLAQAE